ncbi:hypothetical protein K490DRAFT_64500 [Saccharata proteae CBS 121410]|uniref:Uncharacterized protein n=1 Tax=Saccharata proteae CBS 121410 TaxID=1314787 RepID=A0A9P4HUT4_9PEZI|nr:hypothetical protein K490DRAFT_64500 [Saccharata proteae CBS 121410]
MPPLPSLHGGAPAASIRSLMSLLPRMLHPSVKQSASGTGRSLLASALSRRQSSSDGYIPLVYQGLNSGPSPGVVVGIVLGSVAGFLLLVWLLYQLANSSGRNNIHGDEEIVVRERRPGRSRRSGRTRSSRTEVREISRSPRRERIVVEERRGPSMPPPRPRSVLVEERIERSRERRVEGDDIVEVIEEHSPAPRRHRSRRDSRGGYRSVDPELYAGGDYPPRHISRGRSARDYDYD